MARWRIKLWLLVHHGAPPISRYTRVLRAAHGRVKVRSIRGWELYNCTWTVAHITLYCFACFVLIGIQLLFPFNTKQASVSPPTLTKWAEKFSGRLTIETFVSFALRSLYHQNGSTYSSIKCCSSVWCHDGYTCQCLNSLWSVFCMFCAILFRTVAAQFFCAASGPF